MNEKIKQYQLNNWKKYNLVDTKEDFIKLLNILEAHNENLDSLHDVVFNGYDEFCGIYGSFEDDKETTNTLLDYHRFFKTEEEFKKFVLEECEEMDITYNEYIEDEDIRKTEDGFIQVIYC